MKLTVVMILEDDEDTGEILGTAAEWYRVEPGNAFDKALAHHEEDYEKLIRYLGRMGSRLDDQITDALEVFE